VAKKRKQILKVRVDPETHKLIFLEAEVKRRRKPRLIIAYGKTD